MGGLGHEVVDGADVWTAVPPLSLRLGLRDLGSPLSLSLRLGVGLGDDGEGFGRGKSL
jgi:hypothetical protein